MPNQMQEKFEVGYPVPDDEAPDQWINPSEARVKKNVPGHVGYPGGDYESRYETLSVNYNSLPPGSDIEDQEMKDIREMRIIGSGEGDVTTPVTERTFHVGYTPLRMKPTDDMYTNEHQDAFYDQVGEGFNERNNMLDRM